MANEEISQEVRDKLEIARSKVRRVVTYLAAVSVFVGLLYGIIWMGERSAFTALIALAGPILGYWFGERKANKGK